MYVHLAYSCIHILDESNVNFFLLFTDVGSVAHEGVWMGASDIQREGQWLWISGTPLPNSFPWSGGQPDNAGGKEDCLEIFCGADGYAGYNDHICTYDRYLVCELGA